LKEPGVVDYAEGLSPHPSPLPIMEEGVRLCPLLRRPFSQEEKGRMREKSLCIIRNIRPKQKALLSLATQARARAA
jgi:hypothetical protein